MSFYLLFVIANGAIAAGLLAVGIAQLHRAGLM